MFNEVGREIRDNGGKRLIRLAAVGLVIIGSVCSGCVSGGKTDIVSTPTSEVIPTVTNTPFPTCVPDSSKVGIPLGAVLTGNKYFTPDEARYHGWNPCEWRQVERDYYSPCDIQVEGGCEGSIWFVPLP